MKKNIVLGSFLLLYGLLGVIASTYGQDGQTGVYWGIINYQFEADVDLTKAFETVRDATTKAIISTNDFLADPNISFKDVRHLESGFGFRIGYRKESDNRSGIDAYLELGLVNAGLPFQEVDAGDEELFANSLEENGMYCSAAVGVYGELDATLGEYPLSWTASLIYTAHSNDARLRYVPGDPSWIEAELKYADVSVEGTLGLTVQAVRYSLGLRFASNRLEYTETETDLGAGPPPEETTTEYEGEWDSPMVIFLRTEAGAESFRVFTQLDLIGRFGASMGVMFLF